MRPLLALLLMAFPACAFPAGLDANIVVYTTSPVETHIYNAATNCERAQGFLFTCHTHQFARLERKNHDFKPRDTGDETVRIQSFNHVTAQWVIQAEYTRCADITPPDQPNAYTFRFVCRHGE